MSEQITTLREESAAWDARLARANVAREIGEIPFTQLAAWATSKQLTGWSAIRLVVAHPSGAWAGAQLLMQSLPGPLGRLAYAPRAPLVVAQGPEIAAALRSELLIALRSLRADGVTLVRLEPGDSVVMDPEERGAARHGTNRLAPLAVAGGRNLRQPAPAPSGADSAAFESSHPAVDWC